MATVFLVLIIVFAFAAVATFIIACCAKNDTVKEICSALCCSFFAIALIAGLYRSGITRDEKPKEFPAAKYELKHKVTEFDGVSDTTYVLIPKKNESK